MHHTTTHIAYTITDGQDFAAGGYPFPRTWDTAEAAEKAMAGMCWHPGRFAGPFKMVPVEVETSRWGTVLSVTLSR